MSRAYATHACEAEEPAEKIGQASARFARLASAVQVTADDVLCSYVNGIPPTLRDVFPV